MALHRTDLSVSFKLNYRETNDELTTAVQLASLLTLLTSSNEEVAR